MFGKKISTITYWLLIFAIFIAVQAYAAHGQTSEVVGSWKTGSVGAVQYQNQVTGQIRNGRSSIFTYKFLPNGNYEFVGYMEMNMYHCTTTIFNQITGKYSAAGSTIDLSPNRDYWKSTNSCAASGNKITTKPPTRRSLPFETRSDEYGHELLCIRDGEAETCYQREK